MKSSCFTKLTYILKAFSTKLISTSPAINMKQTLEGADFFEDFRSLIFLTAPSTSYVLQQKALYTHANHSERHPVYFTLPKKR